MKHNADELRQEIAAASAELDMIGARLDLAADLNDRAVCRLVLRIGAKWLASLEAQLDEVDNDR